MNLFENLQLYEKVETNNFNVNITDFETDDGMAYKHEFYLNDKLIGEASVCSYKEENDFIFNVEVLKQFRSKGYGTKIIEYMLEHYNIKHLIVDKDNKIAQNLYKKFGFKFSNNLDKRHIRMVLDNKS